LIYPFPQKDAGFNGVREEEESNFLEPYITRGGMERELKNERGFRGGGKICSPGALLRMAFSRKIYGMLKSSKWIPRQVRILADLVLD
jgi:hypothetical protein